MDFDILIESIELEIKNAERQPDPNGELKSCSIRTAPQFDIIGNELNANAWRLPSGSIVLGYFVKPVEGECYTVVFRQCELTEEDRIIGLAARLTQAACKYERHNGKKIYRH